MSKLKSQIADLPVIPITDLPIYQRLLVIKPKSCRAETPRGIIRAAKKERWLLDCSQPNKVYWGEYRKTKSRQEYRDLYLLREKNKTIIGRSQLGDKRCQEIQKEKNKPISLRALAIHTGETLSNYFGLSRSYRAEVQYGTRVTEDSCWSRSWRRTWHNPAAYWDENNIILIATNYNRYIIDARLPKQLIELGYKFRIDVKLPGDIGGLVKDNIGIRIKHTVIDGKDVLYSSGFAFKLPGWDGESKFYWEHAESYEAALKERDHKVEKYNIELERRRKHREEELNRKKQQKKQDRRERLIARLCKNLLVTYQDARDFGYCEQGIKTFAQTHNLDYQQCDVGSLWRTKDERARKVCLVAARKLAKTKMVETNS